jgi:hypothetical protein
MYSKINIEFEQLVFYGILDLIIFILIKIAIRNINNKDNEEEISEVKLIDNSLNSLENKDENNSHIFTLNSDCKSKSKNNLSRLFSLNSKSSIKINNFSYTTPEPKNKKINEEIKLYRNLIFSDFNFNLNLNLDLALNEKNIFQACRLNIKEQIKNLEDLDNNIRKNKKKLLEKRRNLILDLIEKFKYREIFKRNFFNKDYNQIYEFKSFPFFNKNYNDNIISIKKNFENIFDEVKKYEKKDEIKDKKKKDKKKDKKNQINFFSNLINKTNQNNSITENGKEEETKTNMKYMKYFSNYKCQKSYY